MENIELIFYKISHENTYYFKSSDASVDFLDLDFEVPFTPFAFLFGESNKAFRASS